MNEYKIITETIVEANNLTEAMSKFDEGVYIQKKTKEITKLLSPKECLFNELSKIIIGTPYNEHKSRIINILNQYEIKDGK